MSDERDETRGYPSADRPDDTLPGTGPGRRPDDTLPDGEPVDDRTQAAGPPVDDRTQVDGPPVDDQTRLSGSTSVLPPASPPPASPPPASPPPASPPPASGALADDDWAPSRANPVWSGRAEVRSPQPGRSVYDTDWPVGSVPEQRDRWWMPIVVGILVLVLLAALGWGIYLIVQNSGGAESPGLVPTTSAATATEPSATASTATTAPSTVPTTTSPITTPSTTEPTTTEVTVPALRGLALADAKAALATTGLRYRVIHRDSDSPPDTVIDSDPAEGQEVPPDTTVTLVVARAATTTPTTTATTTGPTGGTGGGD